jgi:hypothetical protein
MKPSDQPEESEGAAPLIEGGLIVTGLVAQFFLLYHGIWGDGAERFDMLTQLLGHGTIPGNRYSLVGPLFSAPLWLLGQVNGTQSWWLARYNVIVFAIGLLATYLILKDRIDRGLLRKFLLILVAASMFAGHLQAYYGEVFTAVCVGVGILAAAYGSPLFGWGAVVLGVVNTPATIVGLAGVVLKRTVDTRRLRSLVPVVVAAGLIAVEAWIRRGSPFASGYENRFIFPFFFGLISIVFSFGKGLVIYAPGLLVPVKRRLLTLAYGKLQELYQAYTLWIAFVIGLVLVYAKWYDWSGSWFWGPRYLLVASIPASFALALGLHRRRDLPLLANVLTLLAFGLSCWVGLDGAIFGQNGLEACSANTYAQDYLCDYMPDYSALWRPFVLLAQTKGNLHAFLALEQVGSRLLLYTAYCLVVFAYLAAPLIQTLAHQIGVKARELGRANLRLAVWRV